MFKNKIGFLAFIAIFIMVVSGCGRKQQQNQVDNNQQKQEQNQVATSEKKVDSVTDASARRNEDKNILSTDLESESECQNSKYYADSGTINTSDWKICFNNKLGIQLKYPEGWYGCQSVDNRIVINTEKDPYNVFLKIDIRKNDNDSLFYKDKRGGCNYTITEFGEIFNTNGIGGPRAANGILLENDVYMLYWTIEGDQPMPKDIGGIWVPNNNITDSDIWNILKTVRRIE